MEEILIGGVLLIAVILLSWPKRQQSRPVRRSASTIIREQKQTNLQQRMTKPKELTAIRPTLTADELLMTQYPELRDYWKKGYRFTDYELLTMELPNVIHFEE